MSRSKREARRRARELRATAKQRARARVDKHSPDMQDADEHSPDVHDADRHAHEKPRLGEDAPVAGGRDAVPSHEPGPRLRDPDFARTAPSRARNAAETRMGIACGLGEILEQTLAAQDPAPGLEMGIANMVVRYGTLVQRTRDAERHVLAGTGKTAAELIAAAHTPDGDDGLLRLNKMEMRLTSQVMSMIRQFTRLQQQRHAEGISAEILRERVREHEALRGDGVHGDAGAAHADPGLRGGDGNGENGILPRRSDPACGAPKTQNEATEMADDRVATQNEATEVEDDTAAALNEATAS